MRLGDLLMHERLVGPEQLAAALRTQAQYGGRIGSILVELGLLEVDALAIALAKQLQIPAATQKHFDALDRASLKLIPARTAEKRQAIPLGWSTRTAKTLIVAFASPRDLAAVDEIAALTRARIQPCVAPEVRIRSALSRYYDFKSDTRRFVAVDPSARQVPDSEPPAVVSQKPVSRLAFLSMPPASMPMPSPEPPPVSEERPRKKTSAPPAKQPSLRPVLTLDEALATFELATHRDEVGDTIGDFLATHFRAALVLIVKDGAARGWKGFAPFVDGAVLESIVISLSHASPVRTAYDTKLPWMGKPGEGLDELYEVLGCDPPRVAVAVPLVVQSRVVNVVYGHGNPRSDLEPDAVKDLHIVCNAAAEAYKRILRARVA